VKGTVVTNQGKLTHGLWVEQRADGRNFPYYWLRFGRESTNMVEGTDMAALRDKQVSITPLKLDLTAYEVRESVEKALA
jgi:5'-nucleotidase